MIITKRAIPRRTILRGLGAAVSLPLLESMVPAFTAMAKTPARGVGRFVVIYAGNGAAPGYFTPATVGTGYELTPILTPLERFRDRAVVITGIDNPVAMAREGEPRGGHGRVAPAFMSGVHAKPTIGGDFEAGISIDQIAANHVGAETQLRSLELAVDTPEFGGTCDTGFSCVYTNTISWKGPTQPLPMQNNPRTVFERLFGDSGSTDPETRLARLRERASILDSVLEKAQHVASSVGSEDRRKIDEYLESIRDVERRIQKAEEQSARELPVVDQPAGVPPDFASHVKLMFDLQVLAFQADLTRVITFMLSRELSGRAYPEIGVSEGFHALSHHGDKPDKIADMAKINTHHMGLVTYFLERLQATRDGDGQLLDQALVLYGSGMGNSNMHEPRKLPLVLAGGAGGQLKGGRHIQYPEGTVLSNLHVTLLGMLGVPVESVGDSTGRLALTGI
jgi:hypothetical protein